MTLGSKTDRRALPAPYTCRGPRTPFEEPLADLLADARALQEIGVDDEFFGIGGNSPMAMDLLARIRTALHVDLPTAEFFEGPAAGLAEPFERCTSGLPAFGEAGAQSSPAAAQLPLPAQLGEPLG